MGNLLLGISLVEGKIEFYNDNKKLSVAAKKCDAASEKAWSDLSVSESDKYVWRLERHLAKQAKEYLSVKGDGLENFLLQVDNVYAFADFALGIHVAKYGTKVHVDADIDKIAQHYGGKRKCELGNMTGTVKIDTSKWARGMSVFERDWNIGLCDAWGGFVGYPGYEWPRTAKQFECCCAEHAKNIMIGTKAQLRRYEVFAQKYSGCRDEINRMLKLFSR